MLKKTIISILITSLFFFSLSAEKLFLYQDGSALYQFSTELNLPAGEQRVAVDLPKIADPASIVFWFEDNQSDIQWLELDFVQADSRNDFLMNQEGQKVFLPLESMSNFYYVVQQQERIFLSNENGLRLYKNESLSFTDSLKPGQEQKASLVLKLPTKESFTLHSLSELPPVFPWQARYRLILSESGKNFSLQLLSEIKNHSDWTISNLTIYLLSGEKKSSRPQLRGMAVAESAPMQHSMASAQEVKAEAIAQLHSMELPRALSLDPGESKLIPLFQRHELVATPHYRTTLGAHGFNYLLKDDEELPLAWELSIINDADHQLGVNLPAGKVSIYQQKDGAVLLLGEDHISAPKSGEELIFNSGRSSHILAKRKQVSYERIRDRSFQTEWEITLSNPGEKNEDIVLEQQLPGEWSIDDNSHTYKKLNASTIVFTLHLRAGKTETLRYKVRVDY